MPGAVRILVQIHRWLGVGMCALFVTWFASGVVLMYVPFPALTDAERLSAAESIDMAALTVEPGDAAAGANTTIERLRLVSVAGRPTYVLDPRGGTAYALDGATGERTTFDNERAARIAAAFSERFVRFVEGPFEHDQWTVHQRFDAFRPFFRAELADAARTDLYVSARTGEVLQATTRFERGWNYVGAVVHWIYPTLLRRHWAAWDAVVWWLAFVGILVVAAGITLGILRARRAPAPMSPFVGWLKWHHLLGLIGGTFTLLWIASGWLSMDHGRLFSLPDPEPWRIELFRGRTPSATAGAFSLEALREFAQAKEIEFAALGGRAYVVVTDASGTHPYTPSGATLRAEQPGEAVLREAVAAAWPNTAIAALGVVNDEDAYANLRDGSLAAGVIRVELADDAGTWLHVDTSHVRLVSLLDRSRRVYRWLYNGVHSLDLPLLAGTRPLWDVAMLALLALGSAAAATSLVLAWRRVRLTVRQPHTHSIT